LGVNWKDILKATNYNISNVVCALCSHSHLDHSKSIQNAIKFGLSVYSCEDVKTIHPNTKVLERRLKRHFGGFSVQRVDLFHDKECIGFLIEHEELGRLLFATDTNSIPYKFKNINHFIVEANNDAEYMLDNALEDSYSASHSENHMEISDTIEFLKNNISKETQNIILIHLSSTNISSEIALEKAKKELSFNNVFVAKKNDVFELSTCEF
jgi:phosphoribosyl 1,2-cyclic phosphodiesterase